MPLPAPEPLGQNQHVVEFDCGKPALNDWLIRHARQAQASGSAKTFVVTEGIRVAGYYSLPLVRSIRSKRQNAFARAWASIRFPW